MNLKNRSERIYQKMVKKFRYDSIVALVPLLRELKHDVDQTKAANVWPKMTKLKCLGADNIRFVYARKWNVAMFGK